MGRVGGGQKMLDLGQAFLNTDMGEVERDHAQRALRRVKASF